MKCKMEVCAGKGRVRVILILLESTALNMDDLKGIGISKDINCSHLFPILRTEKKKSPWFPS